MLTACGLCTYIIVIIIIIIINNIILVRNCNAFVLRANITEECPYKKVAFPCELTLACHFPKKKSRHNQKKRISKWLDNCGLFEV